MYLLMSKPLVQVNSVSLDCVFDRRLATPRVLFDGASD